MNEGIKTASLLLAFIVMLGCVYLEVNIQALIIRTISTLCACWILGFTAYKLSAIMIGKQPNEKGDGKSEQSQAKANA